MSHQARPKIDTDNEHYINSIINQSPKFVDAYENDFHLKENSPAIDAGIGGITQNDIEQNSRDVSFPDLGAYEFVD